MSVYTIVVPRSIHPTIVIKDDEVPADHRDDFKTFVATYKQGMSRYKQDTFIGYADVDSTFAVLDEIVKALHPNAQMCDAVSFDSIPDIYFKVDLRTGSIRIDPDPKFSPAYYMLEGPFAIKRTTQTNTYMYVHGRTVMKFEWYFVAQHSGEQMRAIVNINNVTYTIGMSDEISDKYMYKITYTGYSSAKCERVHTALPLFDPNDPENILPPIETLKYPAGANEARTRLSALLKQLDED